MDCCFHLNALVIDAYNLHRECYPKVGEEISSHILFTSISFVIIA